MHRRFTRLLATDQRGLAIAYAAALAARQDGEGIDSADVSEDAPDDPTLPDRCR